MANPTLDAAKTKVAEAVDRLAGELEQPDELRKAKEEFAAGGG
jgi:hypothetical protein